MFYKTFYKDGADIGGAAKVSADTKLRRETSNFKINFTEETYIPDPNSENPTEPIKGLLQILPKNLGPEDFVGLIWRSTIDGRFTSHAEGQHTTASGEVSHAEGLYTTASGQYSHVQGKYNIEDTENKYAHIVGGGKNENNRRNIHTIDWSGNAYFAGSLTLGETTITENQLKSLLASLNN